MLRTLAPLARPYADDLERTLLSDYVLGREMPYPAPGNAYFSQPLTFQERERIRIWIARGAPVRDCGACSTSVPPARDGGRAEAGTAASDAASDATSNAARDAWPRSCSVAHRERSRR